MVEGIDLVGMAVGHVALDHIIEGQDIRDGDILIGIESNGVHSNGLTLVWRAFFGEGKRLAPTYKFEDLDCDLGAELLKPTYIYVKEALEVLARARGVKALVHITSDGFLNLARVKAPVGFEIDALPPAPPIFDLIKHHGNVPVTEMYEVYNMGIGFCIVVAPDGVDEAMAILKTHGRKADIIGRAVADAAKHVRIPAERLVGQKKTFWAE